MPSNPLYSQPSGSAPKRYRDLQRRYAIPFRNGNEITRFAQVRRSGLQPAVVGGNTIFTLRSTARLRVGEGRYSDMTRTVSGVYKFHKSGHTPWIEALRWYDSN